MATIAEQVTAQITEVLGTAEMKANVATAVKEALTPDVVKANVTTQVKEALQKDVTEKSFLNELTETNKAILDALESAGASQPPIYVAGSQQPTSTAPNYLLFVALGLAALLFFGKKVKI